MKTDLLLLLLVITWKKLMFHLKLRRLTFQKI